MPRGQNPKSKANLVMYKKGESLPREHQKRSTAAKHAKKALELNLKNLVHNAMYLPAPISDEQKKPIAKFFGISVEDVTLAHLAAYKLSVEAAKGSLNAFLALRDTMGEKPVEKVAMTTPDADTIAETEKALFGG